LNIPSAKVIGDLSCLQYAMADHNGSGRSITGNFVGEQGEKAMAQYKIVVINPGFESYDIERKILEPAGAEVSIAAKDCDTEDLIITTARDAAGILVREGPVTGRVIESLKQLKIIARYGVGVDNVDLETARRLKIMPASCPTTAMKMFQIMPWP